MNNGKGGGFFGGKLWKFIKAVLFILLLAAVLKGAWTLVERKEAHIRTDPFISGDGNYDVLLLGTSHMMDDVYPMDMWDDFGITSYNLSQSQSTMATNYWVLRMALEKAEPKVVVMDMSRLRLKIKTSKNFSMVMTAMDGFPYSKVKKAAAEDLTVDKVYDRLVRKGEITDDDKALRIKEVLLYNFLLYHNRWKALTEEDFNYSSDVLKGSKYLVNIADPKATETEELSGVIKNNNYGADYARMIKELLDQKGIKLVMTYLPFPAKNAQIAEAEAAGKLAKKLSVPFINFLDMDVVNYRTDMYDANSHLNASGARKVTAYLGQYLRDEFGLPDHRGEAGYESWENDLREYYEYKDARIKEEEKLLRYMMLVSDDYCSSLIRVGKSDFLKRSKELGFLNNIAPVAEDDLKDNIFIAAKDGEAVCFPAEDGTYETPLGTVEVKMGAKERVRINGGEEIVSEAVPKARWIRFYTVRDGEGLVDEAAFFYSIKNKRSVKCVREGPLE